MAVLWGCQRVVRCVTVFASFTCLLTSQAGASCSSRSPAATRPRALPRHGLYSCGARASLPGTCPPVRRSNSVPDGERGVHDRRERRRAHRVPHTLCNASGLEDSGRSALAFYLVIQSFRIAVSRALQRLQTPNSNRATKMCLAARKTSSANTRAPPR